MGVRVKKVGKPIDIRTASIAGWARWRESRTAPPETRPPVHLSLKLDFCVAYERPRERAYRAPMPHVSYPNRMLRKQIWVGLSQLELFR